MKRQIAILLAGAMMVSALAGCGKKEKTTESTELRSGQYDIVAADCVKNVCDYSQVPVSLNGDDYTISDETVRATADGYLSYFGLGYTQITDRNVVQEDDIVLLGYSGKLDGVAFEGGTTTSDIYFDVKNNKDLTSGSSYIEGFNTGLVGATVGVAASSMVTFPDPYPNNSDLAGKEVEFTFDIKGIYKKATLDDITDQMIYDNFYEKYEFATVDDYIKGIRDILEYNMESKKYYAILDAVREYVVANSEVEVPEEYVTARYNEYVASLKSGLAEGVSLEDYVTKSYNVTMDEAEETWQQTIQDEVKAEILFEYIADKEGITLDEDGYQSYLNNIISSDSSNFADAQAVYNYYGNGYADEGEAYVRKLYLVTLAINQVAGNAQVDYGDGQTDDSQDTTENTTEATTEE